MEVLSATQYLNFLQDETEEFEDEYFNEESRRSLTTSTNTLEDESTPLTIQSLKQEKNKQLEQFFSSLPPEQLSSLFPEENSSFEKDFSCVFYNTVTHDEFLGRLMLESELAGNEELFDFSFLRACWIPTMQFLSMKDINAFSLVCRDSYQFVNYLFSVISVKDTMFRLSKKADPAFHNQISTAIYTYIPVSSRPLKAGWILFDVDRVCIKNTPWKKIANLLHETSELTTISDNNSYSRFYDVGLLLKEANEYQSALDFFHFAALSKLEQVRNPAALEIATILSKVHSKHCALKYLKAWLQKTNLSHFSLIPLEILYTKCKFNFSFLKNEILKENPPNMNLKTTSIDYFFLQTIDALELRKYVSSEEFEDILPRLIRLSARLVDPKAHQEITELLQQVFSEIKNGKPHHYQYCVDCKKWFNPNSDLKCAVVFGPKKHLISAHRPFQLGFRYILSTVYLEK